MQPIFEYEDYRSYLKDFYEESKRTRRGFTFRSFALRAGLASPVHLQLVMNGKRNLTVRSVAKFAQGLQLKGREADYFEALVFFTQARGAAEKARYLERLSRARGRSQATRLTTKQQTSLFGKWHYAPIYELVLDSAFVEDGTWISKRLRRAVTPQEATQGLKDLEAAGLLTRDANGRLRQAAYRVRTDDEVENLLVRAYHRRMALAAAERVDDPLADREFGFVTVCTTPARAKRMKDLIKDFVRAANETLTGPSQPGEATEVVQLNVQLFKLTQ